jgi:hypothetical protein
MQGTATQAMCDIVEDPARSAGPPTRPAGRQARQYLTSYATLSAEYRVGNAAAECEVSYHPHSGWLDEESPRDPILVPHLRRLFISDPAIPA